MKELQIGIFGLGTVGSGTVDILTNNMQILEESTQTRINIKTVCVKDTSKERKVTLQGTKITSDPNDILDDPEIDIVVEVMGGIETSKSVIEQAFKNGKNVVSANKDLIALYGKELTDLAKKNDCHFFFEAAVAGGRSEEHTSELQSRQYLVCRLLLEKKKKKHCSKIFTISQ